MQQRKGGMRAPSFVGEATVFARQLRIALGSLVRLGADTILPQHIFPQPEALVPERLLLFDMRQRHLPIPALRQRHPARGIEIGEHHLRIGQSLGLILQPHPLQLLAGLGPVLHVLDRNRPIDLSPCQRCEHSLHELTLFLERLRKRIGLGAGRWLPGLRLVDHSQFPIGSKHAFASD